MTEKYRKEGTELVTIQMETALVLKVQGFADTATDGNFSQAVRLILRAATKVEPATVGFESKFISQLKKTES